MRVGGRGLGGDRHGWVARGGCVDGLGSGLGPRGALGGPSWDWVSWGVVGPGLVMSSERGWMRDEVLGFV